jgi:hypothetical protein
VRLDQVLSAFSADMIAWAAAQEGVKPRVSVASDPWNVLEILVQGPAGLQVILNLTGGDNVSSNPREPLDNLAIEIIVGCNLGLTIPIEEALIKGRGTRPPLLKLLASARARALSLQFPEDETMQFSEYGGFRTVTMPSGIPLAAYAVTLKLLVVPEYEETFRDAEYE